MTCWKQQFAFLIFSQMTGTIQKKEGAVNKQVLDKLKVERERGITGMLHLVLKRIVSDNLQVNAQTARYNLCRTQATIADNTCQYDTLI
jgi:translation elongation factor EF-4